MGHATLLVTLVALALTLRTANGQEGHDNSYRVVLIAVVPVVGVLLVIAVVAIIILSVILVKLLKRDRQKPAQVAMNNSCEPKDDVISVDYTNPIYNATRTEEVRERDDNYHQIGQPLQMDEDEQTEDMSWAVKNFDNPVYSSYLVPHETALAADYTEPSVGAGVRVPWSERSPDPSYENYQQVSRSPNTSVHETADTHSASEDIDYPEPSYENVFYRSPVRYLAAEATRTGQAVRPHSLPPDGTDRDGLFSSRGAHHSQTFHVKLLKRDRQEPAQVAMNNSCEPKDDVISVDYTDPIYNTTRTEEVSERDDIYYQIGQPLQMDEDEQTEDTHSASEDIDYPEPSYENVFYRSPVRYLAAEATRTGQAVRPHSLPPDGTDRDGLFSARGAHHSQTVRITRL